jgi:hypothetical protein
MKLVELVSDLESRVIKVLAKGQPTPLNGGGTEYPYTCRAEISPGVSAEVTYCIAVYNEGKDNEIATYTNNQPPIKHTDLEIGLTLVAIKYPNFKFVDQISERIFKIDVDGVLLAVTLNNKKELVEIPAK